MNNTLKALTLAGWLLMADISLSKVVNDEVEKVKLEERNITNANINFNLLYDQINSELPEYDKLIYSEETLSIEKIEWYLISLNFYKIELDKYYKNYDWVENYILSLISKLDYVIKDFLILKNRIKNNSEIKNIDNNYEIYNNRLSEVHTDYFNVLAKGHIEMFNKLPVEIRIQKLGKLNKMYTDAYSDYKSLKELKDNFDKLILSKNKIDQRLKWHRIEIYLDKVLNAIKITASELDKKNQT